MMLPLQPRRRMRRCWVRVGAVICMGNQFLIAAGDFAREERF
jgi:hypothetical protein